MSTSPNERILVARDEQETLDSARDLGERAGPGAVFALHGPLGSGKTRFAQGLAQALGVSEPVWSPTFTLVNEHSGRGGTLLIHMDLYRLNDEQAVETLGFEELLERATITAIEWPERAGSLLPARTIHVWMSPGATESERLLRIVSPGALQPETPNNEGPYALPPAPHDIPPQPV